MRKYWLISIIAVVLVAVFGTGGVWAVAQTGTTSGTTGTGGTGGTTPESTVTSVPPTPTETSTPVPPDTPTPVALAGAGAEGLICTDCGRTHMDRASADLHATAHIDAAPARATGDGYACFYGHSVLGCKHYPDGPT